MSVCRVSWSIGLYVPRTDGLLCMDYIFPWALFISSTASATVTYIILCFLVRECVAPSLYIRSPTRNVTSSENSLSSVVIPQFFLGDPKLCVSHWFWRKTQRLLVLVFFPGMKAQSIMNSLGPNEFERSIAIYTAQSIGLRSILDFLLMKLRTALDRDWLQKSLLLLF